MAKDLGTYWLLVEFVDGRGYYEKWETGRRYTHGCETWKPLDAMPIPAPWSSESEVFSAMEFQYTDGNNSCDCNKASYLARAYQLEVPEDPPCGDEIKVVRLTAIRPDGTKVVLLEGTPNG